jgi:hypothetical protein
MNKKLKKMIKGKNIIGVGRRRKVYDLGNGYTLKVAKSKDGITNNKQEVMMYRSSPPALKKHLGLIQKHGSKYSWIKMKKYTVDFRNTKINRKKLSDMNGKFRRYGIIPKDIASPGSQQHNLRLESNGEIIVIDYGNFIYRS